ncbi:MAG: hypothetical protein LDLANPLL_01511 [Turneriella sp.]|nr:hypothetical protein [Turneriella sp.]
MARFKKSFAVEIQAIPAVHNFIKSSLSKYSICPESVTDFIIACDEIASNIVEHGYASAPATKGISPKFVLTIHYIPGRVTATFFDSGAAFNPKDAMEPDIQKNLRGEKKGGYGLFLIRKLVDKIVYSARRRLNVTRLVKQT